MIFHALKEGTIQILDFLIQSGANIQQMHEKVGSTLHYAVKHRKCEMVKYLVEKGVDVNIKDSQHQTPLMIAVQNDDESMIWKPKFMDQVIMKQFLQQLNLNLQRF